MEPLSLVQPIGHSFTLEVPTRIQAMFDVETYEPYSTNLFARSCRWADDVVDLGAHVGFFSLVAAHAAPGVRVVAVEASPHNAEVVRRNLAAHPSVRVCSGAFGATAGSVVLQLTEASDNCTISGHPRSPTVATVEVPVITGADLAIRPGGRVLVKMDIDGHELEALDGLACVLDGASEVRVLIEFNPSCTIQAGHEPAALIDRLLGLGLRLFALDERAWQWSEVRGVGDALAAMGPRTSVNLYCVPSATAVTVSAVLHSGHLAGAERSHVEIVEDLVGLGCMVHTVVPEPDGGLVAAVREAGSSVSLVPAAPWWVGVTDGTAGHEPTDEWQQHLVHTPLIAAVRAVDSDVVLTQTCVVAQGAVAAALLGRPHVWWVREYASPEYGLVLPMEPSRFGAALLALSDSVLVNSPGVGRHFFPEPSDRVHLVPFRPRMDVVAPVAEGRHHPFTVGVVGSLQVGKRQSDAIEAVALLARANRDVRLVCIGLGPPEEIDRLTTLARDLGVGERVSLAGFMDDRQRLYAGLDAVIVTSPGEATSRVPFEATAAGLPVVYADAGGPAEYMTSGVTGLAFGPGDTQSLADAIARLMDDDAMAARLVAAARSRFTDSFADPGPAVRDALMDAVRRDEHPPLQAFIGWLAKSGARAAQAEADLRAALAAANDRATAVEQSRIWKLSAPYRRLADRLRRPR